ncbi:MAG: glycosyltransferase family 2 protein [Flavobacteriales bacterium]|nr:glycosyltransferase family 2 protein [Flavobacteriales bacterium]
MSVLSKKIAVVILNWNGKSFLQQFLPSVVEYSSDLADVIVADNCSTDDSLDFLKQNYPAVQVIQLEKNYGFAGGYNRALQHIPNEYHVLLNSDVEVTPNWLKPLLHVMESNNSIAVCQPKLKDFNNKKSFEYAGAAGGFIDRLGYPFCQGRIFNHLEEDHGQYEKQQEIFWASGACFFVRADAYRKAGGLDEFFFAHMEEIDLCWRMKNLGYKAVYVPQSTVYHVGGGTLNKVKPQKTFLNYRNSLLMLHKNLPKNKRFGVILMRLFLDGVSGIKLMLEGKLSHTFAIIRAHFAFYRAMSQNKKKRGSGQRDELPGILHFNLVYLHFIKNVKTFTDLPN